MNPAPPMFGQLSMGNGNGTSFLQPVAIVELYKMLLSIPCFPTLKEAENSFMSGTVAGIMMGPLDAEKKVYKIIRRHRS